MEKSALVHEKEFGQKAQVKVRVPGVTGLFGSYADFCKGYSLCYANDLYVDVCVSTRTDALVKMSNEGSGDHKKFVLSALKFRKEDRWGNYPKGLLYGLTSGGYEVGGLNISFTGPLLCADTQNVACAMCIGVSLALNELYHFNLERSQILRYSYLACSNFCQEHCKYMILVTMLDAKENQMMFFDNQEGNFSFIPMQALPGDLKIMVVESGIPQLMMREEKRHKLSIMKTSIERLKQDFHGAVLRDLTDSNLNEMIVRLDETQKQACSFLLEESRLARDASKDLTNGNFYSLGKNLNKLHASLRDKMDLTCPEIDWIVKRATEIQGCYGASMVYTGISGSIFVLGTQSSLEIFEEKLLDYDHIFGFSLKKKEFHCYPKAVVYEK